jgi:hypothetical protein
MSSTPLNESVADSNTDTVHTGSGTDDDTHRTSTTSRPSTSSSSARRPPPPVQNFIKSGKKTRKLGGNGNVSSRSHKGLKVMGGSPEELLDQAIFVGRGGAGSLDRVAFDLFWAQIGSDKKAATDFLRYLLGSFLSQAAREVADAKAPGSSNNHSTLATSTSAPLVSSVSSSSSSGSLADFKHAVASRRVSDTIVSAMLNSIAFVTLFLDFDTDTAGKFAQDWPRQPCVADICRRYPATREVMRLLDQRCSGTDIAQSAVVGCISLYAPEEFDALSDCFSFPTIPEQWSLPGDRTHLFSFLRQHTCTDDEKRMAVMKTLLEKIDHQITRTRTVHSVLAETTLLASLHILRQFLCLGPVMDKEFLRKGMKALTQFIAWPNPYGSLGHEMTVLLQKELKFPGYNSITKLHNIGLSGTTLSSNSWLCPHHPLHYFFDRTDESTCATVQHLRTTAMRKLIYDSVTLKQDVATPPVQTQFVAILRACMMHRSITDAEMQLWSNLSHAQIRKAYQELYSQAMDSSYSTMEWSECMEQLRATLSSTQATCDNNDEKCDDECISDWNAKHTIDAFMSNQPKLVPLPTLDHLAWGARTDPSQYSAMSAGDAEMLGLAVRPCVEVGEVSEALVKILNRYGTSQTSKYKHRVNLTVYGDDRILHAFVCSYYSTMQQQPELFANIVAQIYLLPARGNHLAAFVARHDGWYFRHCYVPFMRPDMILPWRAADDHTFVTMNEEASAKRVLSRQIGNSAPESESDTVPRASVSMIPSASKAPPLHVDYSTKDHALPFVRMRGLVEDYVRDAQSTLHIPVFLCCGWSEMPIRFEHGLGVNPDQKIPFIQRFEYGLQAHAQNFVRDKQLPPDMSLDDLKHIKDYDSNSMSDAKVVFTMVDSIGKSEGSLADAPVRYDCIVMSHVPRMNDVTFPPNPTSPCLELYAKVSETARITPYAQQSNALVACSSQHVNRVSISSVQDPFHVLLDGQLFGPFRHVDVVLMKDPGTDRVTTFPIQTFFPISL